MYSSSGKLAVAFGNILVPKQRVKISKNLRLLASVEI